MAFETADWLGPLDAERCQLEVLTFKEGVLSAVAHDLRLRIQRLSGEITADQVRVVADASSVAVACARVDGLDAPSLLSASDRQKIEATLRADVLESSRFGQATFEAASQERIGEGLRVVGTLRIHGVARPLTVDLRAEGGELTGEFALHQPDFGIRPYRALLGALKVQAGVRIHVRVRPRASHPGTAAAPT